MIKSAVSLLDSLLSFRVGDHLSAGRRNALDTFRRPLVIPHFQQSKWGSSSIEEISSDVKREDIYQIFFKIEEILDHL